MSTTGPRNDDDEKPLDPAAARIVAKVRMLMLIAGATMMIGIGAIFAVIGYRVFRTEGSAPSPAAVAVNDVNGTLPRGARVIAVAMNADRLALTIEVAGTTEVRLFELGTLRPAGRLRLTSEP